MRLKSIISAVAALAIVFAATSCGRQGNDTKADNYLKTTTVYNGAEIDIANEKLRQYLDADTESEQATALESGRGLLLDTQIFTIEWESDGGSYYVVHVADNSDFENATVMQSIRPRVNIGGTLTPGKTYYYKIDGENKSSKVDKFKVKDAPVRPITVGGASNVRDLGGWSAENGKTIAYGKLYRGGKINAGNESSLTDDGLKTMSKTLGIKTEIDLRFSGVDDGGQNKSVIGDNVKYVKAGFHGYNYVLPEFKNYGANNRNYYSPSAQSIKTIFSTLADESNYPVYFHCNAGADRTGTLAFLIEAALGVSEEDVVKDYEITSFSSYGARYRGKIVNGEFVNGVMQDDSDNFVAMGYFIERLKAVYAPESGNVNEAAVNYLKTICGVTESQINAIKSIMLTK